MPITSLAKPVAERTLFGHMRLLSPAPSRTNMTANCSLAANTLAPVRSLASSRQMVPDKNQIEDVYASIHVHVGLPGDATCFALSVLARRVMRIGISSSVTALKSVGRAANSGRAPIEDMDADHCRLDIAVSLLELAECGFR